MPSLWEACLSPSMQAVLTGRPRQLTCRVQNGLPMGPEAGDLPAACSIVTFKRCEPCIRLVVFFSDWPRSATVLRTRNAADGTHRPEFEGVLRQGDQVDRVVPFVQA